MHNGASLRGWHASNYYLFLFSAPCNQGPPKANYFKTVKKNKRLLETSSLPKMNEQIAWDSLDIAVGKLNPIATKNLTRHLYLHFEGLRENIVSLLE